jgi:regulator of nucleoside diphosphate kinase
MSTTNSCQLTTKDYTILEVVRDCHPMRDETFWAVLQRKISSAVVMFRDDIPANVVTVNSRVAYRVNDGPAEIRIIAHDQMRGLVGMLLPITNLRGLALLGLAEGQSISVPTAGGHLETLTVHEVVYQPEAARRERLKLEGVVASDPRRPSEPGMRVVHRSDDPRDKPHNEVAAAFDAGFEDPGPPAV